MWNQQLRWSGKRGGTECLSECHWQHLYLEPPAADRSNLNCTLNQGIFVTLEPSHARFKEIYAAILYAMATNKRLIVRISEGSSNCAVSYVRAYS